MRYRRPLRRALEDPPLFLADDFAAAFFAGLLTDFFVVLFFAADFFAPEDFFAEADLDPDFAEELFFALPPELFFADLANGVFTEPLLFFAGAADLAVGFGVDLGAAELPVFAGDAVEAEPRELPPEGALELSFTGAGTDGDGLSPVRIAAAAAAAAACLSLVA